jgi:hypothetical protein
MRLSNQCSATIWEKTFGTAMNTFAVFEKYFLPFLESVGGAAWACRVSQNPCFQWGAACACRVCQIN